MTDEQLIKLIEAVRPERPGIWPTIERAAMVVGLAMSLVTLLVFVQIRDQVGMMKVYQSARQSKTSELIGTLRGQGDKRTADILEILHEQEKREMERLIQTGSGGF